MALKVPVTLVLQTTYTYNDLGEANTNWVYDPASYYAPATIGRQFITPTDYSLQKVTINVSVIQDIHIRMFIYQWNYDVENLHTIGTPLYESEIRDIPRDTNQASFDAPNLFFSKSLSYMILFSGQGLERTGKSYFSGIDSGGTEFLTSTYRDGDVAYNDLSKWGQPDKDNYWYRYVPNLAVKLDFGTPVPEGSPLLALLPGMLFFGFRTHRSGKRIGVGAKGVRAKR